MDETGGDAAREDRRSFLGKLGKTLAVGLGLSVVLPRPALALNNVRCDCRNGTCPSGCGPNCFWCTYPAACGGGGDWICASTHPCSTFYFSC
jgi:hypothetical protein